MNIAYKITAVILILFAVILILFIPPFIPGTMAYNERSAFEALRQILSAGMVWCCQDVDGNGRMDHWTMDISCFYRMYRADGQTLLAFIPLNLARADAAPVPYTQNDFLGTGPLNIKTDFNSSYDIQSPQIETWKIITPQAYNGYFFRAMLADENGVPYNQVPVGSKQIPACNYQKFGFVAYPDTYGKDGMKTFIMTEQGIWQKDTGGQPVTRCPDRFTLASEWETYDGKWHKSTPLARQSYPDGVWTVEVSTPGGHHTIPTVVYDDQLTFTETEISSKVFASQGYAPAEYTNVKYGKETKWSALQKNKDGGIAVWCGQASSSNYIFGRLAVLSADGKKDRYYYFASSKAGPPIPKEVQDKAEFDIDELQKEFKFRNFDKDYAKGLTTEQKNNVLNEGPLIYMKKLLEDKDSKVRSRAVYSLGWSGNKKVAPDIRKMLQDNDERVRSNAIDTLAELDDRESIPEIRKLLNDSDDHVRASAVSALGKLGDKESAPSIRKLLNDSGDHVRADAARVLGKLGDKESASYIRKLLNDTHGCTRLDAIIALIELDDKESIPDMCLLLNHEGNSIRGWAAIALVEFGAKDKVPKEVIQDIKAVLSFSGKDEEMKRVESVLKELGVSDEEIKKAKER